MRSLNEEEENVKILHTSDWHLGRCINQRSLIEDQRWLFEKSFVPMLDRVAPDIVLVAGDIYDRPVPGQDAVELLDDILREIVLARGIPTVVIAGNHDGGTRLGFGADLLCRAGLYMIGHPLPTQKPIELADGKLAVVPVPYFDPLEARALLNNSEIANHDQATRAYLDKVRPKYRKDVAHILVGHLFAQGGQVSESERILAPGACTEVGGAGQVAIEALAGWDYVALGHLHRPQEIAPGARYSGSILQYSFSEPADKSVVLVELDPGRPAQVTLQPLNPMRRLRCLKGRLDDILSAAENDPARDDYVRVEYEADHPVPFVMERVRERYPNALEVVRARAIGGDAGAGEAVGVAHIRSMGLEHLFGEFHRLVSKTELSEGQQKALAELVAEAVREPEAET